MNLKLNGWHFEHMHITALARVAGGCLLYGFAAPLHAGGFTWTGAASLNWNNPQNWSPQQVPGIDVPGANASVQIADGVVQVTNWIDLGHLETGTAVRFWGITASLGSADTVDLQIVNATVNCSGPMDLSGETLWQWGMISGAGGEIVNLGTLSFPGIAQPRVIAKPLRNVSTVEQDGTITVGVGGSIVNQATWNFTGTNQNINLDGQATGDVVNQGTIRRDGAGSCSIWPRFDNHSIVDVQHGALYFKRGGTYNNTFTLANDAVLGFSLISDDEEALVTQGASFTGTGNVQLLGGVFRIEPGVTVNANLDQNSTTGFTINSGDFNEFEGTLNNVGKLTWISGSIDGPATTENGGGIHNSGSIFITGGGQLRTVLRNASGATVRQSASILLNDGTIDIQQGSTWELFSGNINNFNPSANLLINDGLLNRTGNTTSNQFINVPIKLLNGTFEVTGPGNLFFAGGGELAGAGKFDVRGSTTCGLDQGTYIVTGSPIITGSPDATFKLDSDAAIHIDGGALTNQLDNPLQGCQILGTVTSSGPDADALVNQGYMKLAGAKIGSPSAFGKLVNQDELEIVSVTTVYGEIENADGAIVRQNGGIALNNGMIINHGTWRLHDVNINGTGAGARFENHGTLIESFILSSTIGGTTVFDNQGTVIAESGILKLYNVQQIQGDQLVGGTWKAMPGGAIEFPGTTVKTISGITLLNYSGGSYPNIALEHIDAPAKAIISADTLLNTCTNLGTIEIEGCSLGLKDDLDNDILGEIEERLVLAFAGSSQPSIITPALNNQGILRPGGAEAPGPFNLIGTLNQLPSGRIEIELGGTEPITGHDQVNITGDANLAGTLIIRAIDGFELQEGQQFTILTTTGGTIAGQFEQITGPNVSIAYAPNSITITIEGEAVPGDITGDGSVNVADLLAVIGAWGACASPPANCPADIAPPPDGDGHVNVYDLLMVINNWN